MWEKSHQRSRDLGRDLKWGYHPSTNWMRLLRVGEIPAAEWRSDMDPTEGNYLGSSAPGSDEGARRLVFVFSSGKNPISGTSNRDSEREKSLQQSRDSEWGKSQQQKILIPVG